MKRRRMNGRRGESVRGGFTLIEVLAALLIFGVALVAFMQSLGESTRLQGDLASRRRAEMLAQNLIEELRLGGDYETGNDDGEFKDADAIYRWSTEITADPQHARLNRVTVRIDWNDGRERRYELTTLLADVAEAETQGNLLGETAR